MPIIGNPIYQSAFVVDQFSGNGSTVAFTMSVAPAGVTNVLVAVSGVLQDPSTYGVVGNTITFSAAPPTGTGNISCRYLGVPVTGVTTTAYRTVTEFTATASQTTFTPPSYTPNFINVYLNGVLLGSADYTATNGTTVVLATGASAGNLVTVESFQVSSVLNAIPNTAGAINLAGALVSGTLPVANGGTGVTTSTGSGANVLGTSPTLTTPTLTSPTISGTPVMGASVITSGTAVASTSGTSIDFTGIPNWVKRVTVNFSGVSTNGASHYQIQLGTASSIETTGYQAVSAYGPNAGTGTITTGFPIFSDGPTNLKSGAITFTLLNSASNTWVSAGGVGQFVGAPNYTMQTNGDKNLGGVLTRIRITTVNGTDTFDAGSINILYE